MADLISRIERLFDEVVNQGQLDVADELFAPEFVSHGPQGDIVGIAAFKEYVRAWRTAFPDIRCTIGDPILEGDRVAWVVRATGTHLGDMMGIPATARKIDFLSMNHGRAVGDLLAEHWVVMDQLTMFQQLGIVPALAPS